MIISGIYKITNLINNKNYIGRSNDILNRWGDHINHSAQKNHPTYNFPLYQDFREYGLINFSFTILEDQIYDIKELIEKERQYIIQYNGISEGYNQYNGFNLNEECINRRWSDEEKEILKKLYLEQNLSQSEIARRLNRTKSSINAQISRMKIVKKRQSWTPDLENLMLKLRNEGKTQKEVGIILGFSKEAVKKRWSDKMIKKYGGWK